MIRPLNVVLIGLGMVAEMHAAAIAATQGKVRLAAVCARRRDHADAFAARHGVSRILNSVQDVAGQDGLDFAILTTPPDARAEFIETLVSLGISILMEKPVARSLAEARALVAACQSGGVPLGIVLQHRMRPAARALADRIEHDALGRIASVELRVPWWRDQSYYQAPGRGTYDRDGGGVLMTQAIHSLDLMLQLCGPVRDVQGVAATTPLHRLETEDFAAAALRFQSGAVGSVMASVTHFPGGAEEMIVNGTAASAYLGSDQLRIHHHSGKTDEIGTVAATGGGADPMAFSHAWHQAVIEDFADAVQNARAPAITGQSALAVHALIEAITRSAASGQREKVEPTDA